MTDFLEELRDLVEWMDDDLDGNVAEGYKEQPGAQHWARVAKVCEEAGEAIDALIGVTGQNPRKGIYCDWDHLYDELCDVALTGIYALQHFTKSADETTDRLIERARYHRQRRSPAVENETEKPEDTVRRFASRLVRIEAMIDAELERVRHTDDLTCEWWQRRRRQWTDGVGVARACSENALWKIKSALHEDRQQ